MFAWIFFRAFDFRCALSIITRLFVGISNPKAYISEGIAAIGIETSELRLIFSCIFALAVFDYVSLKKDVLLLLDKIPRACRFAIYIVLTLVIIYFVPVYGNNEFIYFQF